MVPRQFILQQSQIAPEMRWAEPPSRDQVLNSGDDDSRSLTRPMLNPQWAVAGSEMATCLVQALQDIEAFLMQPLPLCLVVPVQPLGQGNGLGERFQ